MPPTNSSLLCRAGASLKATTYLIGTSLEAASFHLCAIGNTNSSLSRIWGASLVAACLFSLHAIRLCRVDDRLFHVSLHLLIAPRDRGIITATIAVDVFWSWMYFERIHHIWIVRETILTKVLDSNRFAFTFYPAVFTLFVELFSLFHLNNKK